MDDFHSYAVHDRSYLSYIKREIHNAVMHEGFSSMRAGEIDIIISELTSNLIKHAGQGELIYRFDRSDESNKAFEVFCIDKGPGSNIIHKLLRDGISTTNTLGHGLGSIKRLSDKFEIYSGEGLGTIVYSKSCFFPLSERYKKNSMDISAIKVSMPGETVCGDGYHIITDGNETRIFMGDGLGHGPHAYEAISQAIEAFKTCEEEMPTEILRFIHRQVKKTRGLVGTVAIFNRQTGLWRFCGIGNITTRLTYGQDVKSIVCHNGIIGLNIPATMNNYEIGADRFQHLLMYSDGIKSQLDIGRYPGLLKQDPGIIAAVIYKDHARRTDDMAVLVGKVN